MNIHYLELFYHVAKHGGIAAAVRRMPYGIQQPAVSGQIARLEEALGGRLFERRPFRLLPSGIQLFEFVSPFFDHLDEIELTIRSGSSPQLRIAAPAVVLEQYLPEILERVRRQFPQFRLSLHEAGRAEAERLLSAGEVDVAVLVLERKARSELPSRALLELPLVLLVPAQHPVKTARQLWRDNPVRETLICFPRRDPIQVLCQEGLHRAGVEWFPGIEVSSTRLIECYVARGYGIGVVVATPGYHPAGHVRMVDLPEFPAVVIGAAWSRTPSPIASRFLAEIGAEAARLNVRKRLRKKKTRDRRA